MQKKSSILVGLVVEETAVISMDELCAACTVQAEQIVPLVDEGILEPVAGTAGDWRFPGTSLQRARRALRLQRELQLNLAGVALALDLMEEVKQLRNKLARLERLERQAD